MSSTQQSVDASFTGEFVTFSVGFCSIQLGGHFMSASSSKQLVFSTMRSDFLRMFFQWLLAGDQFAPDSSVTEPPRGSACYMYQHHRRSLPTVVLWCVQKTVTDLRRASTPLSCTIFDSLAMVDTQSDTHY